MISDRATRILAVASAGAVLFVAWAVTEYQQPPAKKMTAEELDEAKWRTFCGTQGLMFLACNGRIGDYEGKGPPVKRQTTQELNEGR